MIGLLMVAIVTWWVPALTLASHNLLFRLRGTITPLSEITILAIDDQSLQQIGPWPWPRSVMAEVIDRLTALKPRAIGLDVLYAETPDTAPDLEPSLELARAVAKNGRVVMPAQLYDRPSPSGRPAISWLRPAPLFADQAAMLGHVHVAPGIDGMVRSVQLSKASDQGERLWAFAIEVIRLADGIDEAEIVELPGSIRVGGYRIPVIDPASPSTTAGVTVIRSNEMPINFAGSAGTFRTLSISDLLADKVEAHLLRDQLVLIGATAQSMGDSRIAPFTHFGDDPLQGGREMPGVEIHANIINTIRARLNFRTVTESTGLLSALLSMLLTLLVVTFLDGWRQIIALGLLLAAIITGSYLAFARLLILPPLVEMVTGFTVVIPFLINRSLVLSRELDTRLAALAASAPGLLSDPTSTSRSTADRRGIKLPYGFRWKLQTVESLTTRLLARVGFINRVLSSMGEGVIVTDLDGRIILSNQVADEFFLTTLAREAQPLSLIDLLGSSGHLHPSALPALIQKVIAREVVQLDYTIESVPPRHLTIFLSALVASAESEGLRVIDKSDQDAKGVVVGMVLLLSDVTKRVELDRLKTETVQLVSHELRAPLSSIHALSEVLLKFSVSPDESREMLATINSEARRLGETISLYLDLNRLESGARPLNCVPTDLPPLISTVCRLLTATATQKQIRIVEDPDSELPRLTVDPILLSHALTNLLSNAIKYSPPRTTVRIGAHLKTDELQHICLTVRDQGYGIPPEVGERIFERFYRLDRDHTSGIVGSGLGLALVREIAERHGGSVTFHSLPEGGTEFTLSIPLTVHRRHTQD